MPRLPADPFQSLLDTPDGAAPFTGGPDMVLRARAKYATANWAPSWTSFEERRVRLESRATGDADYIDVVGSPDLVVEIVSDSSVAKDTRLLRAAYCRAMIREYWLIDARGPESRMDILVNEGERFTSSHDPAAQESRVLGGRWMLTRSRNRAGRFTYALNRAE